MSNTEYHYVKVVKSCQALFRYDLNRISVIKLMCADHLLMKENYIYFNSEFYSTLILWYKSFQSPGKVLSS